MSNPEKIIHIATELWDGSTYVSSLCGQKISYLEASILYTNCPICKEKLFQMTKEFDLEQIFKSKAEN